MQHILLIAVLIFLVMWAYVSGRERTVMRISFLQSLLLGPIRLAFRVRTENLARLSDEHGPLLYVAMRQSSLDAALFSLLLPSSTEHLYSDADRRSMWLAPFRALTRNSGNQGLVFQSRVRSGLRDGGRVMVYLPAEIEPSPETQAILQTLAEIVAQKGAQVRPLHVAGSRHSYFSAWSPVQAKRHAPAQSHHWQHAAFCDHDGNITAMW